MPNWTKSIGKHLQSTEIRLWHMAIGFFVVSLVTFGSQFWLTQSFRQQTITYDRSQELVAVSIDFENRVHAYISSGTAFNELGAEPLTRLNSDIEAQIRALNSLAPILKDEQQKTLVEEYFSALVVVRDLLSDGLDYTETQEFGIGALAITSLRNKLLSTLV